MKSGGRGEKDNGFQGERSCKKKKMLTSAPKGSRVSTNGEGKVRNHLLPPRTAAKDSIPPPVLREGRI